MEEALYGRPGLVEPGRGGTRLVYCTTTAGRYLLVVVAEAPDGRDFVVTARDMTETAILPPQRAVIMDKGKREGLRDYYDTTDTAESVERAMCDERVVDPAEVMVSTFDPAAAVVDAAGARTCRGSRGASYRVDASVGARPVRDRHG